MVIHHLNREFWLMYQLSSVIAINLLSTDEILRAGRSSLKPEGQQ